MPPNPYRPSPFLLQPPTGLLYLLNVKRERNVEREGEKGLLNKMDDRTARLQGVSTNFEYAVRRAQELEKTGK